MSEKYYTGRPESNLNSDVGVPLAIFSFNEKMEAAVLETGMDTKGEIHRLENIVRPDVGIITNVGISHIERLGSREAILKEKLCITDFFGPDNTLVINGDNDMFIAGLQWRYVIAAIVLGGGGILGLIQFGGGYWKQRFTSFTNPFADPLGDGYQVVQSLLALGTGGLFGLGLGKSVQKNLYLPEPQNDFILAIIGEELGFVGIALLFIAYAVLIWRCIHGRKSF